MWLLISLNLAGKIAAVLIGGAAPLAALVLWLLPDALVGYHLFMPRAQGLGRMHRRFTTARREVWLTIDDGPDPADTPQILALLATRAAHATFFVIGTKAACHPGLIQSIRAGGHEVAHHTQTHPLATFWCASPARVARELDLGLEVFRSAGVNPVRFRPPAGIRNLWLAPALRARGLIAVGWSARGLEHWPGDAGAVAARVLRGLAPGSILLMHEGPRLRPAVRVAAVRRVLERLDELGYRCVVPQAGQLVD